MKKILVVAPHADDESLGCGGTIFRHVNYGDEVHWMLVTSVSSAFGFDQESVLKRKKEIDLVAEEYGVKSIHELGFQPAGLDTIPITRLVSAVSSVVMEVKPEIIYTAFRNDAHTDHAITYDAVMSATKVFRYPYVQRILTYETLSETDFGQKPEDGGFKPNVFHDITPFLSSKLTVLKNYSSEMGEFPFPRSYEAVEALAKVRGVQCGCKAAEAFMLVKEVVR